MTTRMLCHAVAVLVVAGVVGGVGQLSPASAQTIAVPGEDKFIVTDPNPSSIAGRSVAISGDTAVVGAPLDDTAGNNDTGAAYVYIRSGIGWTLQARLTHGGNEGVRFGSSVAISGDTVVVGAPQDDITDAGQDRGAAYVFTRSGSSWGTRFRLVEPTTPGVSNNLNWFGTSVGVSGDTVVVGVPGFDQEQPEAKGNSGAAYVFTRSGSNWVQQGARITPSENMYFFQFGLSVSVAGDSMLVGAPGDPGSTGADGALDVGRAWVFTRSDGVWTQQAKLVDPAGVDGDLLGWAVALDGDTAVVGARGDDGQFGSAFVFTRSGASWSAGTKLTAPEAERNANDRFGDAVAVGGGTVVIGAPGDDTIGTEAGSAYVFTGAASTWTYRARLDSPAGSAADEAGQSVALSGDTALVGAPSDDPGGSTNSGAGWVFSGTGASWSQQATLTGNGISGGDRIGETVDISGDTAVIGMPGDDTAAGKDAGSAFVFVRSGDTWIQQAKLAPSDPLAGHQFGSSVAISGDRLVVGSPGDPFSQAGSPGAAYAFLRSGESWGSPTKLTASDGLAFDSFGSAAAIDGTTIVIGAWGDDSAAGGNVGAAYAFALSAGHGNLWTQQGKLTDSGGAATDRLGRSVAVSGDTAIVGALGDDTAAGEDAGSAVLFTRSGGVWSQQQKFVASDGEASDWFGASVAVDGGTALVGAPHNPAAGADEGSAYLFIRSGDSWRQRPVLTAFDGDAFDQFGSAVALSSTFAVIGAARDSTAAGASVGSAYAFASSDADWSLRTKIAPAEGLTGDYFASAVALDGDDAVVGAPSGDTVAVVDSGATYGVLDLATVPEPTPTPTPTTPTPTPTDPPNEPPTVTTTAPTASAPITGTFTAAFSEAVTGVSASTFTLKVAGSGAAVPGAVSQPTPTTARFAPTAPLMPGQSYTARLTTGIEDLDGMPLAAEVSWTVRISTTVDSSSVAVREQWDVDSSSAASGGAYSVSSGPGSRKAFTFTGTNVTVYGLRSAAGGYANIYLDGARVATVSCYGTSTKWKQALYVKSGLSNAMHTVEVRPTGTKPSGSRGTNVYVDAFKVGSATYQEVNASVRDSFRRVTTKSAFGASYELVAHATSGDTGTRPWYRVQFKGTDVKVYATRSSSGGKAVVYVDGVAKGTMSLYSSSGQYRVKVFDSAPLTDSVHTIQVVVLGTPSGAGSNVGIDYFVVG